MVKLVRCLSRASEGNEHSFQNQLVIVPWADRDLFLQW